MFQLLIDLAIHALIFICRMILEALGWIIFVLYDYWDGKPRRKPKPKHRNINKQ